jgi:hypothetical protein
MRLTFTECPINICSFSSASMYFEDRAMIIQCNIHVRTYRNLAASSNLNQLYVKAQIGTDLGYEIPHTKSQVWNLEEASEP